MLACLLWGSAGLAAGTLAGQEPDVLQQVGSTNLPVVSMFWESDYSRHANAVLCIWRDGRIICSTNAAQEQVDGVERSTWLGGPPYWEGRVPLERLDRFLQLVQTNRSWLDLNTREGLFPLHFPVCVITVELEETRFWLKSGADFNIQPQSDLLEYSRPPLLLGELISAWTNVTQELRRLVPASGMTNVLATFRPIKAPAAARKQSAAPARP